MLFECHSRLDPTPMKVHFVLKTSDGEKRRLGGRWATDWQKGPGQDLGKALAQCAFPVAQLRALGGATLYMTVDGYEPAVVVRWAAAPTPALKPLPSAP